MDELMQVGAEDILVFNLDNCRSRVTTNSATVVCVHKLFASIYKSGGNMIGSIV